MLLSLNVKLKKGTHAVERHTSLFLEYDGEKKEFCGRNYESNECLRCECCSYNSYTASHHGIIGGSHCSFPSCNARLDHRACIGNDHVACAYHHAPDAVTARWWPGVSISKKPVTFVASTDGPSSAPWIFIDRISKSELDGQSACRLDRDPTWNGNDFSKADCLAVCWNMGINL